MRRRSFHPKHRDLNPRSTLAQPIKVFVIELAKVHFALPLSRVDRVVSTGPVAEWEGESLPIVDLHRLLHPEATAISPTAHYKLILSDPQPWSLQVPKIPSLLTIAPDDIHPIPQPELSGDRNVNQHPFHPQNLPMIANRFMTLTPEQLAYQPTSEIQTLFFLDLSYLESLVWEKSGTLGAL